MVRKQYREDHQVLKLAFIEAMLDTQGYYSNKTMSKLFGNHDKDASRIVRRYKEMFPDTLQKQGLYLVPTAKYTRQILKPYTDAWAFINHLEAVYGVGLEL